MSPKTDLVIKFLQVISWIIFIGLSILAGTLLFNFVFVQFNPFGTKNLYMGLDLSELFQQDEVLFTILFGLAIGVTTLKAISFYHITRIFEKLTLVKPFSEAMYQLISKISSFILLTGILGALSHQFSKGLEKRGYEVTAANQFWDDYSAFLMMAAVVFVIAQIFKKGLELQSENDLTV